MTGRARVVMSVVFFSGVAILSGPAATSEPAKPGDKVKIHFTCKMPNGTIAATSDEKIAKDSSLPKAPIFIARQLSDPVPVEAGDDCRSCGDPKERGFEGEIVARIAKQVVGMKQGESQSFDLEAPAPPSLDASKPIGDGGEAVIQISRERMRPKQIVMTKDEYRQKAGKEPQVSEPYVPWRTAAIPCKVSSISEKEVTVQCRSENGAKVETPFGKGVVTEMEKGHRIVIDAKVGQVVRSGGFVGRIVNVDDRMITVDYRHPFGGEELKCEVKVESIQKVQGARYEVQGETVSSQKTGQGKPVISKQ